MANWIYNKIIVTGTEKDVSAFKEFVENPDQDTVFDFNKIIPPSKYIYQGDVSSNFYYRGLDWITWNENNWGTPFNASFPLLKEKSATCLEYKFSVFRSFPKAIFEKLTKLFPGINLIAYYLEEYCVAGEFIYDSTNKTINHIEVDISTTKYDEIAKKVDIYLNEKQNNE